MFDAPHEDEPDLPGPAMCEICGGTRNCAPCMCEACRAGRSGAVNAAIETAVALGRYGRCLAADLLHRERKDG
jgi:hypothetical protein